jgi:two-component system, chemotaxis family, protein-glutamate methylesterase/glutaminase
MAKIRVLVANRPRLMRELVLATIADQPDIEIVGELLDESRIQEIVTESEPDVLIMALEIPGVPPLLCRELLERYPRLKIVALAPERNSSMLLWGTVDVHSTAIESSEDGILSALFLKGELGRLCRQKASQVIHCRRVISRAPR